MKRLVLEVFDLRSDDMFLPKKRYALKLECGHTVLRSTNLHCANNKFSPGGKGGHGRLALCEVCRGRR